jgi:hypothetical protein
MEEENEFTGVKNIKNYGFLFTINELANEDPDADLPISYKEPGDPEIFHHLRLFLEKFQKEPFTLEVKPTDCKNLALLKPENYGSILTFGVPAVHLNIAKVVSMMLLANFLGLEPLCLLCGAYIAGQMQGTAAGDMHKLSATPDVPFTAEEIAEVEERYPQLKLDYSPPEEVVSGGKRERTETGN